MQPQKFLIGSLVSVLSLVLVGCGTDSNSSRNGASFGSEALPRMIPLSVNVSGEIPYDTQKISIQGDASIEVAGAEIRNQKWISSSLTYPELETMLKKYPQLRIIAYRDYVWVLVEYDDTDAAMDTVFQEIKKEKWIISVFQNTIAPKTPSLVF